MNVKNIFLLYLTNKNKQKIHKIMGKSVKIKNHIKIYLIFYELAEECAIFLIIKKLLTKFNDAFFFLNKQNFQNKTISFCMKTTDKQTMKF